MKNFITIFILLTFLSNKSPGQNFFDRVNITSEQLPLINTAGSEFSPVFVDGELYYTAERENSSARERSKQRNTTFYDLCYTQTDVKGYPQILRKTVPGFGQQYHEGPVAWCEATGELFVTQSNLENVDISRKVISKEHIRLRLVIMKRTDEKWLVVEKLPFNQEVYNFAHPAINLTGDTLIFSSDMQGGFGKSDLYMSVRTEGQWSVPQNLGKEINTAGDEMFPTYGPQSMLIFSSDGRTDNIGQLDIYYTKAGGGSPVAGLKENINSEYDDFGFIIHPSGEYGYFSSNRPGSGSDDIYRVEFTSLYENIGGVVVNSLGVPVPEAEVYLQDCNGNDLKSARSSQDGRFNFEVLKGTCYQAVASKHNYEPDKKPYHLQKSVQLIISQIIKYQIWVYDIENEEPLMDAEVFCNEQKWLTNTNGIADIDTDSLKKCNPRVTREGYLDYIIEGDPYRFVPGVDIKDKVWLFRKTLNKPYIFQNIGFFLDKWRLLPESEQELGKLIKLMKDNPSLKIELASHTDSRGEDQYNLWLSQKRSDSATDYLIENGISKERIVSKGYGETRLINHCANGVPCSEAEHMENRRTDFTIIDF